ncbi:MAG: DUF481 domain-containing protein [Kiritimatiellae bacterium]|jgi:putative salt-induced outer membrane protein YdiY|nr:DUF481 domain-containing protein [Kiritimatiellia bacterium]
MKRTIATFAAAALATAAAFAADAMDAAKETSAGLAAGISEEEAALPQIWQGKIAAGVDLRSGNTEKEGFSAHADAKKLQGKTVVVATVDGAYEEEEVEDSDGTTHDEQTVGQVKGAIDLKQRFGLFFVYGRVSADHDDIADLKYRFIESIGAGAYLVDLDTLKLSAEAGVAQVQEKYAGMDSDDYTAWRVAERCDWTPEFAEGVSFFEAADFLQDFDESDRYLANGEAGMDIPMFLHLSLTLKGVVNYNNMPAPGNDKTDTQFVAQVGYNF